MWRVYISDSERKRWVKGKKGEKGYPLICINSIWTPAPEMLTLIGNNNCPLYT